MSQSFINYTFHNCNTWYYNAILLANHFSCYLATVTAYIVFYPYFRMSQTVPTTPLSGTQLMLMECKLLTWQQTSCSPRSQTFQMGFWPCPYLWANHCQRMQWHWTWPSTTLSPPTGVMSQGTLSPRWWRGGHRLCSVSWNWLLDIMR